MSTTALLDTLLDLTPQQRNLLLMRPLFQLELTKNKFSDSTADGRSLFEGVDTHYLSLAALTHMMEGTAVAVGYTQEEVVQHLASIVSRMKPAGTAKQWERIAEIVVDALDNASNNYLEHSYEYFHAPSGESRKVGFRLTTYEPDLEDSYRYHPTAEGYLVLMGMLDLKVEDHQILVERMLQLLIERGRFDQAYEFARRARMLSIEHRQQIRDFIHQAWRAPGSVAWAREIAPRLHEARMHIHARQEEDRRLEESVREQLIQVTDDRAREQLVRLHGVLKSASGVRAHLQVEVIGAGDKFMDAQVGAFRSRRPSSFPDLETRLLPEALATAQSVLAESVDALLLSLYPAIAPKAPDLSNVLALLLARREYDEPSEDDSESGELLPFKRYHDPFPENVMQFVQSWVSAKFSIGGSWKLDELLAHSEDEGLTPIERQCIVYVLYRSYPDSESLFKSMRAHADGAFMTDVAAGDNLRFDPAEIR
ncbi:hypothetical protein [Pseudomonas sp. CGJS7]|uniref:hypothetical protein n=1 Tax=Pseudomonas sp. CGJS7 TaxID=3109348 RepID=UPI00300862FC